MNDHELELEIAKQAAIHVKEPVRNGQLLEALKELRSTRTQLERERMCHAACGVIAMSNTPESLKRNRQMHQDYLSGSVQDCIKAAEREIALRSAIEEHHDQKADDRCWLDDLKLYAAAGLEPADNTISDPVAMLANCQRFIECRMKKGEWPTYQQLEDRINAVKSVLFPDGLNYEPNLALAVETILSNIKAAMRREEEALTLAGLKDQSAKDLRTQNNNLHSEIAALRKQLP